MTAPGYPQGSTICSIPLTSLSPFAVATRVDTVPPSTVASSTPAPNGAGWNNTSVVMSLHATDNVGGSGVQEITLDATGAQPMSARSVLGDTTSLTIVAEGLTTVDFFATDQAGNAEGQKTLAIQVDETRPTVTYSGNASVYTVDQRVTITCNSADPANANGTLGSGLAATTCGNINGPAYNFQIGSNTFSASATDSAGNVGTASTSFTVQVTFGSLCALTSQFIESSPRFLALPPKLRSRMTRAAATLCRHLADAQRAWTPSEKGRFIGAYQREVSALVAHEWLTQTQAAILITLSRSL